MKKKNQTAAPAHKHNDDAVDTKSPEPPPAYMRPDPSGFDDLAEILAIVIVFFRALLALLSGFVSKQNHHREDFRTLYKKLHRQHTAAKHPENALKDSE